MINCSELIFTPISWIQVWTVIRSLLSPNLKGQEFTLWLFLSRNVVPLHPESPRVHHPRSSRALARPAPLLNCAPGLMPWHRSLSHGPQHLRFLITLLAVICYLELSLPSLCSVFLSHELGLYFPIDTAYLSAKSKDSVVQNWVWFLAPPVIVLWPLQIKLLPCLKKGSNDFIPMLMCASFNQINAFRAYLVPDTRSLGAGVGPPLKAASFLLIV